MAGGLPRLGQRNEGLGHILGQDLGLPIFNDGIVRLSVGSSLFATAVVSYIVRARLVGQDANLEEASSDLYARPVTTFRRVTLALAMPAVIAGFLLAFTLSLDNTIIAAFVQVSGATPWPVYVLSAVRSGLRPEIAAVSTVMLVLTLLALAVVALLRQIGVLHARLRPMGVHFAGEGPERLAPAPATPGLDWSDARPTVVAFTSPGCEICAGLVPGLRSLAATYREVVVEVVDHEVGLLEVVDPVVGAHHPLEVEADPVRRRIVDRKPALGK